MSELQYVAGEPQSCERKRIFAIMVQAVQERDLHWLERIGRAGGNAATQTSERNLTAQQRTGFSHDIDYVLGIRDLVTFISKLENTSAKPVRVQALHRGVAQW